VRLRLPLALLALLLAGTALLYGRTARFPFVNWDDPIHVYRNRGVVEPQAVSWQERWLPRHLGYPMPLTLASYHLDRALHGPASPREVRPEQGRGYHVTNLLLMLVAVGLVFALCLRVAGSPWAAALGAAVFAAHPASVETVAWITGRKELLVTLLCAAAALAWLRHLGDRRVTTALGFALLSLAALASKPSAVLLVPFALWTLWVRPDLPSRRSLREGHVPAPGPGRPSPAGWLALGAATLAAAALVLVSLGWQRAVHAVAEEPWSGAPARSLYALGFHLRLLVWPVNLRLRYLLEPGGLSGYHLLGGAALVVLLTVVLHPRSRRRPVALGAALVLLGLLPSHVMPLQRFVADTYLFLPLVGVAVLIASSAASLLGSAPPGHAARRRSLLLGTAGVLLLPMLATLSWVQVGFWRDSETLWRRTLSLQPDDGLACRMLGEGQIERGDARAAITTNRACARRFGLQRYANNLGIAYYLAGDHARAREVFQWILARHPGDPRALKYLSRMTQPAPRPSPAP